MATRRTKPDEAQYPEDGPGTDVAEVVDATVAPVGHDADPVLRYLSRERGDVDDSKLESYQAMIRRILMEEDIDEMMRPIEVENASLYKDHHLTLTDVTLNESSFEEGAPFFITLNVFNHTVGVKQILNTGWQSVVAKGMRLLESGTLPRDVVLRQAKNANRFGKFPLNLFDWVADNGES